MTLDFDLNDRRKIKTVEFGVGVDLSDGEQAYNVVPTDGGTKDALYDMAVNTWKELQELSRDPPEYNPAEKPSSREYVYVELDNPIVASLQEIHSANNLEVDSQALSDPAIVYCYFARLTDTQGRRLTALQRAAQFKGVLKRHFLHVIDDSVGLVQEPLLRLDTDFDLLVDSSYVHVLRPAGLETIGRLQKFILEAVPQNVRIIRSSLKFVDFGNIETYALSHPRAARYLASIRAEDEACGVAQQFLEQQCQVMGIPVNSINGKLGIPDDRVLDFLALLDRRLYDDPLIPNSGGHYKASSRTKV
jgi:hypothetical protein